MTLYFSKEVHGFFDSRIHGKNIPADAVPITEKEHADLLSGQSKGKVIICGSKNKPELAEPTA